MPSESKTSTEPKICGACGETFGCGAKLEGCWCTGVTLTEEAARSLANAYSDCLCPKCLETICSAVRAVEIG